MNSFKLLSQKLFFRTNALDQCKTGSHLEGVFNSITTEWWYSFFIFMNLIFFLIDSSANYALQNPKKWEV